MKTHPDGNREVVIGTTGSGKTFYLVRRVANVPRIIAIDPKRTLKFDMEHDAVFDGDLKGLLAFLKKNERGKFRVIYEPEPYNEVAETHMVARLIEIMQGPYQRRERGAKKIMAIIEEAPQCIPNPPKVEFNGVGRLATMGREMGIDLIAITQRPQKIDMTFREMMDGRITCFRVVGENAVEAAAKMMNSDPTAAEKIRNLGQFEHVSYENGKAQPREPLKETSLRN